MMNEINVNTKIPNLSWHISATMECKEALQQLGIKYEMRVCSHLLSCYLLLTTVDNPLSMSQWDRCYSILQEMVG